MLLLNQAVVQAEKAAALAARALQAVERTRGLRSGDRVFTPLQASAVFSQGSSPARNVIFNVPSDADFWAYRLLLYPQCRVIDPVNGTGDDVTWRGTSFTGESYFPGPDDNQYTSFNIAMDGTFGLLYEGKELQNNDLPFAAAFTSAMSRWAVLPDNEVGKRAGWVGGNATPGGHVFDIPFFLPRGKSLTLRLSPSYLGVRTIVETIFVDDVPTEIVRQNQYRIMAILEGEKRVNAFR